ncbi:MAG: hypothetical protein HGA38_02905 [Candidatus Moranbacteria bacterium]|nr:hypothetical protein [Candidatus Moranbacteria bacterium]
MTWTCFERLGYSRGIFEKTRDMIYLREYREQLRLADGAIEVLRLLVSSGHKVIVVTSRVDKSLRLARDWFLEVGGPDIPFIGVGINSEYKKMCKASVLSECGVQVYVDNSSKKLLQIAREWEKFPEFPHLLHFISHGEIANGKNAPCPFAEPLFSWRHLPSMLGSPRMTG